MKKKIVIAFTILIILCGLIITYMALEPSKCEDCVTENYSKEEIEEIKEIIEISSREHGDVENIKEVEQPLAIIKMENGEIVLGDTSIEEFMEMVEGDITIYNIIPYDIMKDQQKYKIPGNIQRVDCNREYYEESFACDVYVAAGEPFEKYYVEGQTVRKKYGSCTSKNNGTISKIYDEENFEVTFYDGNKMNYTVKDIELGNLHIILPEMEKYSCDIIY